MVIDIQHAVKKFQGTTVLNDVTLSVDAGERVIILGQNGAGKTTLLRSLLGLYRLDSGRVQLYGFDPLRQRDEALSRVAFIPQLPPPLPLTVAALVGYAQKSAGVSVEAVTAYAERFGLPLAQHWNKPFLKLSGGMKQKLLASLAFARQAPLMLFDEPTANLDPQGRDTFGAIIREPTFAQTTMVFISHRVEELNTVLNRAVWLDLGRIVKDEPLH